MKFVFGFSRCTNTFSSQSTSSEYFSEWPCLGLGSVYYLLSSTKGYNAGTSTKGNDMQQLEIRNTIGGMVWQVYHVETKQEIEMLTRTARGNDFEGFKISDTIDREETWLGWRDTDAWKHYLASEAQRKSS